MKKNKIYIYSSLISLIFLGCFSYFPSKTFGNSIQQNSKDYKESATLWLNLLDQKQYNYCYNELSNVSKKLLSKENWILLFSNNRDGLGPCKSRKVSNDKTSTNIANINGNFATITFDSVFSNSTFIKEELILIFQEQNQKWFLLSYKTKK